MLSDEEPSSIISSSFTIHNKHFRVLLRILLLMKYDMLDGPQLAELSRMQVAIETKLLEKRFVSNIKMAAALLKGVTLTDLSEEEIMKLACVVCCFLFSPF